MQRKHQRKNGAAKKAPAPPSTIFPAVDGEAASSDAIPSDAVPATPFVPLPPGPRVPIGMPASTAAPGVAGQPPEAGGAAQADVPFTAAALLGALGHEPGVPYRVPSGPAVKQANIAMLEAEVAAAATVHVEELRGGGGTGRLRHVLDTLGFAIVAGVLSPEEQAAAEQMWADDLRRIVVPGEKGSAAPEAEGALLADPVHRWPMEQLPLGSKFASDWGLPHGQCAWYCRSRPAVQEVFRGIFGDVPLCCGCDNVFFNNRPSVAGANAAAVQDLWPHADQSATKPPAGDWSCYQGVLYVWPAGPDTSATVVWPTSHKRVYPGLMEGKTFRSHFCRLPGDQYGAFARNARRVPVPAGGMLLWNSRTIHQGWSGGARLAVPICFEPTVRRSAAARRNKVQCVVDGLPTSHWASLGEVHRIARPKDEAVDPSTNLRIRPTAHRHQPPDGPLPIPRSIYCLL